MNSQHKGIYKFFVHFVENLNVEHLDVVLRIFVQSLDGGARKWFKFVSNASITTWEELDNYFMQKWGEKRDHGYILIEFNAMKKKHNEDVSQFIKSFNKLYNRLLAEIKPPQVAAKVVFVGYFEPYFGFTLRERNSCSLD